MKLQIRQNVFETNSSSTHSLTMMMKSDFEEWEKSGKYLYKTDYNFLGVANGPVDGKLYTDDEVIEFIKLIVPSESAIPHYLNGSFSEYGFKLFTDEDEELESFYDEFTTPNGETVVAFGEYGYDL